MNAIQFGARRAFQKAARTVGLGCPYPHSHAQEGEDLILFRLFRGARSGLYVDVGAHHPIKYSNTFLFYQKGWRGVNIDGMPGSMKLFHLLRGEDKNIEALVASERKQVEFFIFNDPAVNTCDPELARSRDGREHFRLLETRKIETRTLAEILHSTIGAGRKIDFLSVDVEGLDLDVLRSNDWKAFTPRVVLAEDCDNLRIEASLESPIASFLEKQGYSLFAKTVNTLMFINE